MKPERELRTTLERSLREHDEAAIEAMRRAQSHLERAHELHQRLAQLGGKRTNGANA